MKSGDPDHKELIEVAGEDRQKLHPFQQGFGRIQRLLEHPEVETDPAELAVDHQTGIVDIRDGFDG